MAVPTERQRQLTHLQQLAEAQTLLEEARDFVARAGTLRHALPYIDERDAYSEHVDDALTSIRAAVGKAGTAQIDLVRTLVAGLDTTAGA